MATQKLVFQTNDEVKQNWNWGCSLPCPDAGYKYHRPGATKAVDAKAGFSCGFQWSGGVGVQVVSLDLVMTEKQVFCWVCWVFFGRAESVAARGFRLQSIGLEGAWASVVAAPGSLEQRLSSCGAWAYCLWHHPRLLRTRD